MKPTIQQVARQAGVSVSTVSRVLNNHPAVLPTTREHVQTVIRELQYVPSRLARGLSSSGFDSILVVYTRSSSDAVDNPYFSTVINAIGSVAEKQSFDLILHFGENEGKEIEKAQSMINSNLIKGVILLSSRINNQFVSFMAGTGIPMVVVGKIDSNLESSKLISVDTDNYADSRQVGRYLAELGHRRIGCIHAPLGHYVSVDRLAGFRYGLHEQGVMLEEDCCADGGHTVDSAYRAALGLLCSKKVTAIFATDDIKAFGVYRAAKNIKVSIPRDVSVIGYNDFTLSTLLTPALTTIRVPIYDLGIVSASKLFSMMQGSRSEKNQIMPTELIVRDSVRNDSNFKF